MDNANKEPEKMDMEIKGYVTEQIVEDAVRCKVCREYIDFKLSNGDYVDDTLVQLILGMTPGVKGESL